MPELSIVTWPRGSRSTAKISAGDALMVRWTSMRVSVMTASCHGSQDAVDYERQRERDHRPRERGQRALEWREQGRHVDLQSRSVVHREGPAAVGDAPAQGSGRR